MRTPQYPTRHHAVARHDGAATATAAEQSFWRCSTRRNLRATILASVPWFLQDLGTYGIGIFTPTILAAAFGGKPDHVRSISDLILNDILAAKGAALITSLLIVGIIFAIMLADRVGRIRLQIFGFIGCAAGLLLASFSDRFRRRRRRRADLCRLHAVQLHDQSRAQRADLSAGGRGVSDRDSRHRRRVRGGLRQDRRGATAFLFPILLATIGTQPLLYGWSSPRSLGAAVTWLFRIETTGVNLDHIGIGAGPTRRTAGARARAESRRVKPPVLAALAAVALYRAARGVRVRGTGEDLPSPARRCSIRFFSSGWREYANVAPTSRSPPAPGTPTRVSPRRYRGRRRSALRRLHVG